MTDASDAVPASRPYAGPVGERGSWGRPQQPANLADILEQLLFRLHVVAEHEIPDDYKHVIGGQMVGRIDDCRLTIEHNARVCGKSRAHAAEVK